MSDYGFSEDPQMVRVDLFEPSGKWYTTVTLKFDRYNGVIYETFNRCLCEQYVQYVGYTAVCLEPCHEHEHPLMTRIKKRVE